MTRSPSEYQTTILHLGDIPVTVTFLWEDGAPVFEEAHISDNKLETDTLYKTDKQGRIVSLSIYFQHKLDEKQLDLEEVRE